MQHVVFYVFHAFNSSGPFQFPTQEELGRPVNHYEIASNWITLTALVRPTDSPARHKEAEHEFCKQIKIYGCKLEQILIKCNE